MISPSTTDQVRIPGTVTHQLNTSGLEDALQIDVALPCAYEQEHGPFPVVYLLDGHWLFSMVSGAARLLELAGELRPLVIVGIGYAPQSLPRAQEEDRILNLRCRDLTPTRDDTEWWRRTGADRPLGVGVESGHAEDFLEILAKEVKPWVQARFRVDVADQTLAGHSLGGLFALSVLFRHTECFQRYIAGSPSLWWDQDVLFDFEQKYAATHSDLPVSLFVSVGSLEVAPSVSSCRMVGNVERLSATLRDRRYPSLRHDFRILEDESHASGMGSTFVKGLVSIFRERA